MTIKVHSAIKLFKIQNFGTLPVHVFTSTRAKRSSTTLHVSKRLFIFVWGDYSRARCLSKHCQIGCKIVQNTPPLGAGAGEERTDPANIDCYFSGSRIGIRSEKTRDLGRNSILWFVPSKVRGFFVFHLSVDRDGGAEDRNWTEPETGAGVRSEEGVDLSGWHWHRHQVTQPSPRPDRPVNTKLGLQMSPLLRSQYFTWTKIDRWYICLGVLSRKNIIVAHDTNLRATHPSSDWSSCQQYCVVIGWRSFTEAPDRDIGPDSELAIFRSHLPRSGPDPGHHNK